MTYAERLREMLKRHEGLVLKPYEDSVRRKITIGVGRNLTDNGITMAEAEMMLEHDIKLAETYLSTYPWFAGLCEPRKAAFTDLMFNVGPRTFMKFREMQAAISAKHWEKAAEEMLDSLWRKQVGRRAEELAEMVRTGEWA